MARSRCYTCRIKSCSFLKDCSKNVLEEISDLKQHFTFERGELIVRENEEINGVYFISSGVAKVMLNDVQGRPLIIRLLQPGEVFGHRINNKHKIHPASIVAIEKTNICFVPLSCFLKFFSSDKTFFQGVINQYLNDVRDVELRTLFLAYKTVRQKVAGAMLQIAKAYQYQHDAKGIRIHLERQEIADLASTTKEQVSKILFDLKSEGLINFRAKHFKYINTEALQGILDGSG
ncbi:Crp/Fnr family transcriptional regulator [Chitinophagaceae bacterium LB-8]|uniref:Crp/Fnr family transcriptional regulator n=1 Tax=Paraflavisolibacter caeni TaxID=2982496 RepID=A0A9X2XYE5_9BACT|nr:Crp/Fnr family transcriptional regulator [Paraflavisolibacter caeni]MCU7551067.1 Crp/Fnr family transcriptional regulator [Paraflavisolibacter caeni]